MTKTCEACGVEFSCGGYQCWCGKVGITETQMDWIASHYKDCLCPACLGKVSTGELGPQVMPQTGEPDKRSQAGDV